jgi:hypothetical protein
VCGRLKQALIDASRETDRMGVDAASGHPQPGIARRPMVCARLAE